MPQLIARMSAGTAVYKQGYSRIATAPTKLAEYLACGVPCLGSCDVGDTQEVLEGNCVGVAMRGNSVEDRRANMARLLELVRDPETARRCVATARALFSLDGGVSRYRELYKALTSAGVPERAHARDTIPVKEPT
jgi:glycosyltransferase involved in cell wall biosynthesis